MQNLLRMLVVIASVLLFANAPAVTVVECIDASGNSSFRDKCPPGSELKGEKVIRAGGPRESSLSDIAAANPIVFYTVPDCDACDLIRNSLTTRNIPFREKDVQDNATMQEELHSVSGSLTVPAVKIGEKVLTGYSRDAIDDALANAGYPVEGAAAPISLPPEEEAGEGDDDADDDTTALDDGDNDADIGDADSGEDDSDA